ncbi:hypothetical protein SAMN02745108_00221 [Fibrobacter intestinalis]|uniref:Uncharacterized protein n=1 Tax=Fibrobacter intestinalis TaxID=28122 RepID=A0A1T4JYP3_9BACT|nr:hypothetical protein BGW94_1277 [Fibrobacter sp. NR9]SJZ35248.1 hypothetical protein SAMN02745108_00221 [Fibrobacter intestinalis]
MSYNPCGVRNDGAPAFTRGTFVPTPVIASKAKQSCLREKDCFTPAGFAMTEKTFSTTPLVTTTSLNKLGKFQPARFLGENFSQKYFWRFRFVLKTLKNRSDSPWADGKMLKNCQRVHGQTEKRSNTMAEQSLPASRHCEQGPISLGSSASFRRIVPFRDTSTMESEIPSFRDAQPKQSVLAPRHCEERSDVAILSA